MRKSLFILSFTIVICTCLSAFSCKKSTFPLVDSIIKDVSYGNNESNKLDLGLPANRTMSSKLIIFIHGGGWNSGDKADLTFITEALKNRGFVVANINYRLSPQNNDNYKMQLDDIDNVIHFLISKASYYTYSSKNIYIIGHSAGAHLALSYAYSRNTSGIIKAAAGMASPTNLYSLSVGGNVNTISSYLGIRLSDSSKQRYLDCSPIYHVNKFTVATILFQGDQDTIVPKEQSILLATALNQNGVHNKIVIYPFVFHDWWSQTSLINNTLDETAIWFNTH